MDISRKITLVAVVLLALALTACAGTVTVEGPDGTTTEYPAEVYAEQQRAETAAEIGNTIRTMAARADSQMSSEGEVAHSFMILMLADKYPKAMRSMGAGYYDLRITKTRQRHQTGRALANIALPFLLFNQGGGGGDTELNFGNRVAKGGGSSDREGGGSVTSASGDTEFNDLYFTIGDKSPFQYGDGTLASGKDSQIQLGDGVQGQVFSRPFNQPGIATEGGEVNNDSQGLTGNEGDIGL